MYCWRDVPRCENHWPREPGEPDHGQKATTASDSIRVLLRVTHVTGFLATVNIED